MKIARGGIRKINILRTYRTERNKNNNNSNNKNSRSKLRHHHHHQHELFEYYCMRCMLHAACPMHTIPNIQMQTKREVKWIYNNQKNICSTDDRSERNVAAQRSAVECRQKWGRREKKHLGNEKCQHKWFYTFYIMVSNRHRGFHCLWYIFSDNKQTEPNILPSCDDGMARLCMRLHSWPVPGTLAVTTTNEPSLCLSSLHFRFRWVANAPSE